MRSSYGVLQHMHVPWEPQEDVASPMQLARAFNDHLCASPTMCSRTGLPHLKWRPSVLGGGVVQLKTADALGPEESCGPFLEVFRQPPSKALGDRFGAPACPMECSADLRKGVKSKLGKEPFRRERVPQQRTYDPILQTA